MRGRRVMTVTPPSPPPVDGTEDKSRFVIITRTDHRVSGAHQRRVDAGQPAEGHTLLSQQGVQHTGVLIVHQHVVRDSVRLPDRVDRRVHRVRRADQEHTGGVQRVQTHR